MITGSHIVVCLGEEQLALVPGNQSWAAECAVEELDGATAESEGYDMPYDGIKSCRVTAQFVVDISQTTLYAGLTTGTFLTALGLYTHIEDAGAAIFMEEAIVLQSTYRGEVRGRVTYDVVIKNRGPFEENY